MVGRCALFLALGTVASAAVVPAEPVEIGTTPQFFVDDYIVDNRWAVNFQDGSKELVVRALHQPKKYEGNPVLLQPGEADLRHVVKPTAGYVNVRRDAETGLFRMWYQASMLDKTGQRGSYAISYAESTDGMHWTMPNLGLLEWNGTKANNVVWLGASPGIVDAPESARRGFRYLMIAQDHGGINLLGSPDGIHWDAASSTRLVTMHSDTANSLVYDPQRREYVLYCRSKKKFEREIAKASWETGEPRRIARMASRDLWSEWSSQPQNILIPDELDAQASFTAFYGMTAQLYGGIYWGFIEQFKWNTDIQSELAFSRDGIDFDRLPTRPRLIPLGRDGTWDDGMILVGNWVEVGDEWWIYYSGNDGPHGAEENRRLGQARRGCIGLAKLPKERFISLRGPEHGGVVATRDIRWPGGSLVINGSARDGVIRVRVVDENRQPITGFGYEDCTAFTGDELNHRVQWTKTKMESLQGRAVRLEFFLQKADLFTFRAGN